MRNTGIHADDDIHACAQRRRIAEVSQFIGNEANFVETVHRAWKAGGDDAWITVDGGLFATPIINFPEVGILGVHQIKQKPVVKDGQIVIGDVMLDR